MATVAHLASPLIYVGEVLLPAVHISYFFGNAASKFLVKVLDTNTSPIQLGANSPSLPVDDAGELSLRRRRPD